MMPTVDVLKEESPLLRSWGTLSTADDSLLMDSNSSLEFMNSCSSVVPADHASSMLFTMIQEEEDEVDDEVEDDGKVQEGQADEAYTTLEDDDVQIDDTEWAEGSQKTKSVQFGAVEIHEHSMGLSLSAVPRSGGAPLGISWERQRYHYIASMEEYEAFKPAVPRRGGEMVIPNSVRVQRLLSCGYTMSEIRKQAHECTVVQTQRKQSSLERTESRTKMFVRQLRKSWEESKRNLMERMNNRSKSLSSRRKHRSSRSSSSLSPPRNRLAPALSPLRNSRSWRGMRTAGPELSDTNGFSQHILQTVPATTATM